MSYIKTSQTIRRCLEIQFRFKIPGTLHLHHIDGNRQNNDIRNLMILTPREHSRTHEFNAPKTRTSYIKWLKRLQRQDQDFALAYETLTGRSLDTGE